MMLRARAFLGAGLLIVALSTAIAPASANRLSFSASWSTRGWRGTWARVEFATETTTISCPVTLEGSFHNSTFAKTRSLLVGYVTDARVGQCPNWVSAVLSANLPWHVQYEAFTGALPNISSVKLDIIGFEISLTQLSTTCLMRSTEANPLVQTLGREAGGTITSSELSGRFTGSFPCPGVRATGTSGRFGTPPPPPPPATTITLSLI